MVHNLKKLSQGQNITNIYNKHVEREKDTAERGNDGARIYLASKSPVSHTRAISLHAIPSRNIKIWQKIK